MEGGRRECVFGVLLMATRVIRWEREFLRHQNFASVDLCDDVRRLKGVAGITSDRNGTWSDSDSPRLTVDGS